MRKLTLFLSYSRADLEIADALRAQISGDGHQVWQDVHELLAGDEIDLKLRRNLRACDGYVVLITPNSIKSAWVLVELGGAWVSGIQLFPVNSGTAPRKLPGPLHSLNCCQFTEVKTKLLPKLARLARELEAGSMNVVSDVEAEAVAAAATSHLRPQLSGDTAVLVRQALSSDRSARRLAHTAVREGSQELRTTFLETMLRLTRHTTDRVRAEAYYCLGDIPLDSNSYAKDEAFFKDGLFDESPWVQACCANVLRNFVPIGPATVDRLQECLTANIYKIQTSGPTGRLIYYASRTLKAHLLSSSPSASH